MCDCSQVNAKLQAVEEECHSLQRALSIEVESRLKLEGNTVAFGVVVSISETFVQGLMNSALYSTCLFEVVMSYFSIQICITACAIASQVKAKP